MKEVAKSTNLRQFHTSITAKILGYDSADYLFDKYSITSEMISKLDIDTLLMTSKDDPIVSYKAMPH
jgi:predicted alpha/beta-fold hydrolase